MMPHVEGKERERYHKELEKLANPVRKSEGKKLTNKELMEILSRR
jgi:benzoyl-CoA reductase/2-hydroxyglutaryl-CoA dehydratase subunit BcrC/BadD/HgdB